MLMHITQQSPDNAQQVIIADEPEYETMKCFSRKNGKDQCKEQCHMCMCIDLDNIDSIDGKFEIDKFELNLDNNELMNNTDRPLLEEI